MKDAEQIHACAKLNPGRWSERRAGLYGEAGEPDYLVSHVPDEAIRHMIQKPMLAVVEAKQEKFSEGWGQCVAEMIACQHLNHASNVPVFGIVTSGEL